MITNGNTTTVARFGHLIDMFIRTKQLSGYPGQNDNIAVLSDDNYSTSTLKLMHFDQTFENMPYDASKCKTTWFSATYNSFLKFISINW